MKRREFLRWIPGVVLTPGICVAKLSKDIRIFNTEFDSTEINFKNIKINGTFNEWIKSIKIEVEKLLKPVNKYDEIYSVKIVSNYWYAGKDLIPAKKIVIWNTKINSSISLDKAIIVPPTYYFSFAKMEFERNKHSKKYLKNLVNTRFISMIWSIEYNREKDFKLLKKFNPKHKTPNYYLH